jgi:hypothetical protein
MANDDNHYEKVGIEIQRHLEDSEVSKLSHFAAAGIYEKRHRYLVGTATGCAIVLTWILTSPLDRIFSPDLLYLLSDMIPVFLSLVVSILTALGTWLNFNDLAIRHRMAAQNYQALWRNCKNWETDFPDESTSKEAAQMVKQYRDRLSEINRNSPQIPHWAWKTVSKQREEGSTSYEIEEENKT